MDIIDDHLSLKWAIMGLGAADLGVFVCLGQPHKSNFTRRSMRSR